MAYPISPATAPELIVQSLQALGAQQDMVGEGDAKLNTIANWLNKYFMHVIRFSHLDPEGDGRLISGIDTRGSSASCYWDLRGPADTCTPVVYCKASTVLRIGQFQQIDVVL